LVALNVTRSQICSECSSCSLAGSDGQYHLFRSGIRGALAFPATLPPRRNFDPFSWGFLEMGDTVDVLILKRLLPHTLGCFGRNCQISALILTWTCYHAADRNVMKLPSVHCFLQLYIVISILQGRNKGRPGVPKQEKPPMSRLPVTSLEIAKGSLWKSHKYWHRWFFMLGHARPMLMHSRIIDFYGQHSHSEWSSLEKVFRWSEHRLEWRPLR
jgi:hypothetical protein